MGNTEDREPPVDLIPLAEAARLVGIPYTTLQAWAKRGDIQKWRRGGRIFVSRAEVERAAKPKPQP